MSPRWLILASLGCGCAVGAPAPEAPVIHARFDPTLGVIPKPNDLLRDDVRGVLDLPSSPMDLADKSPAEAALILALEGKDGWPKRMTGELLLSGAVDPASIDGESIRVFQEREGQLVPVSGVGLRGEPEGAPTKIVITPPAGGWVRGGTFVVAALGGEVGLRGLDGEPVVADAAFWFLRLETPLTEHASAIPGGTRTEREESAAKLEKIRLALAPRFESLEDRGLARKDVALLWAFTVTSGVEVVMDKEEGKMPLPSDFLVDPATRLVALPSRSDDSPLFARIKTDLNRLDGFALSANLSFELDDPIDPATLDAESVRVYALPEGRPPVRVSATARTRLRDTAVSIELVEGPLLPATRHLVVLTKGLKDLDGTPVSPMLPGLLALLEVPLYDGRASLLGILDGESAAKVELVRSRTAAGLSALTDLPRDQVAVAWSFDTMTIDAPMRAARDAAEIADVMADPLDVEEISPIAAGLDFPLGALTLLRVGQVFNGFITVPDALDPLTKERRPDGRFEQRRIAFTMTVPRGHDPDEPLRVAIFAHGLMTERRFVLALGDALAAEDMAAIAIDLPYHGLRTHCVTAGPQCLINPLDTSGPQICPAPCNIGSSCAPDGTCVSSNGEAEGFALWPIVGFPQASGGAFVDVDSMHGTRDHFYQAITDLSALRRSLVQGDWRSATGYEMAEEIGFVGQSLGGLLGAVYAAVHPGLERAVLNVPGADVIELFRESQLFASHLDAFLDREGVQKGTEEHERVLNIGRWIMDPIDPQSFARFLLDESFEGGPLGPRTILIQMATLDVVIPNDSTRTLERLSGVRREDYVAEHGFLVIPIEPAYLRGVGDVARLLGEGLMP